jgi:hypothetical protein
VIIGGTACDIMISEFGFRPRATKDIDIILLVEALIADFARQFWSFVVAPPQATRNGGFFVSDGFDKEYTLPMKKKWECASDKLIDYSQ